MSDQIILVVALSVAALVVFPLFGMFIWTVWDTRNIPKFPPAPDSPYWDKRKAELLAKEVKQ